MRENVERPIDISIVTPVFNEEQNLPQFLTRVTTVLDSISPHYEIIFAVDPGSDGTTKIIEGWHAINPSIKMIEMSRRFGQPMATLAGLDCAIGEAVIIMDVDLQDPPELIRDLVAKWRQGFDVVLARRTSRRGETFFKRTVAKVGYAVINRFSDVPIPVDTGDFRLLDRRVVDELKRFPEANGFLRGLVALVGFQQTFVEFDRPERFAGRGKYNRFFGSLKIGFNGIVAFSNALLNLATIVGSVSAAISGIGAFVYVGLKVSGVPFPIGNPTIVFLILFVGGIQLICLGIMGQYIGRIYEEVRQRPRYIIARRIGVEE